MPRVPDRPQERCAGGQHHPDDAGASSSVTHALPRGPGRHAVRATTIPQQRIGLALVQIRALPPSRYAQDDVAGSKQNPFRGKLFNKPTARGTEGYDVYDGCNIDYRGSKSNDEQGQLTHPDHPLPIWSVPCESFGEKEDLTGKMARLDGCLTGEGAAREDSCECPAAVTFLSIEKD